MGVDRNLSRGRKRHARKKKNAKPKIVENSKKTLVIHTKKTNVIMKGLLQDFNHCKKPLTVYLRRKNDISPFEDITKVEFLSKKNDSALFCTAVDTKKRKNNLIIGRFYEHRLLDMVEFGVENLKRLTNNVKLTNSFGSKPCLLFQGSEFINSPKHKIIKNLLIDFFKGIEVKMINLKGIDHVYSFTSCGNDVIYMKHYRINMKNVTHKGCGSVSLIDIGPSMNLRIRRDRFASDDLRKKAMMKPQQLRRSKKRNKSVFINKLGEKVGRIHVKQQNIKEISLRRFKRKKSKGKGKGKGKGMENSSSKFVNKSNTKEL